MVDKSNPGTATQKTPNMLALEPLGITVRWQTSVARAPRPVHDRQAGGVGHGDEAENAEQNVGPLPQRRPRHAPVVQHGLWSKSACRKPAGSSRGKLTG